MADDQREEPGPDPAEERSANGVDERWARELIARVALSGIAEQRRSRRWGIFFKALGLLYLTVLIVLLVPRGWEVARVATASHAALINVEGIIAPGSDASADRVIAGLEEAFESNRTMGVIVRVNSPGGSPVQAASIYDSMRRLRGLHPDTPLYAVIEDIGASGGYFVAAAADEIYANRSSIVGSIGVRTDGFGFTSAMEKIGVERRLYTSGEQKGILDPFSPSRPEDVKYLEGILGQVHQHFIDAVQQGRGERLRTSEENIFSGLFWTGERGVELGLLDGFGDVGFVARELIGADGIMDFTPTRGLLDRFYESAASVLTDLLVEQGGALR
jgi:protease-4